MYTHNRITRRRMNNIYISKMNIMYFLCTQFNTNLNRSCKIIPQHTILKNDIVNITGIKCLYDKRIVPHSRETVFNINILRTAYIYAVGISSLSDNFTVINRHVIAPGNAHTPITTVQYRNILYTYITAIA